MYSQAKQDEWVLSKMAKGTYLEIGASHPIDINNTYALEQAGWTGLSIDINAQCKELWNRLRFNPLLITDALTYKFSGGVDYLQLDIDPAYQTLQCLKNVLQSDFTFKFLTFEHDHYTGNGCRDESRELLLAAGYRLEVADVQCHFGSFEDWWVNETWALHRDGDAGNIPLILQDQFGFDAD